MNYTTLRGDGLNLSGFSNKPKDEPIKKSIFKEGDDVLEKAKKQPIGYINDTRTRMKVADVKGNFKASWRYIASTKAKKAVMEEFGSHPIISRSLEGYNPDTKQGGGVDMDGNLIDGGSQPTGGGSQPEKKPEKRPVEKPSGKISSGQIVELIRSSSVDKETKMNVLGHLGITKSEDIAIILNQTLSETKDHVESSAFEARNNSPEEQKIIDMDVERQRMDKENTINQNSDPMVRFDLFIDNLGWTIRGDRGMRAMIGYGSGGIGKTHLMKEAFKKFAINQDTRQIMSIEEAEAAGHVVQEAPPKNTLDPGNPWRKLVAFDPEDHKPGEKHYDYVIKGGKTTPGGGYGALYLHKDKIVVFDDYKGVLDDKTMIEFLKKSLDSTPERVGYESMNQIKIPGPTGEKITIPNSMIFTGRMILLTNMTKKSLFEKDADLGAVTTRFNPVDLTMSKKQTLGLLNELSDTLVVRDTAGNAIDMPKEHRDRAINFYNKYESDIPLPFIQARTFDKLTKYSLYSDTQEKFEARAMSTTGMTSPQGDLETT